MSALGYNYPAGAEHDPRAPWNQPSDCEECNGSGRIVIPAGPGDDKDDTDICPECQGLGREKTEFEKRQEWLEEKADMERDER